MSYLSSKIGLSVSLDSNNNRLVFGEGVLFDKLSIRTFADLAPVVKDKNLNLSNDPAYFMYRNVRLARDEAELNEKNLRFDITVIPPTKIGEEFVKTFGHYHPKVAGTAFSYPELYFVASGEATFLLQKDDLSDIILTQVVAGSSAIIPPGYGHTTINQTKKTLVMANWVCGSFKSQYGEFEKIRGASYYIMDNVGKAEVVKNPNYSYAPKIRELKSNIALLSNEKNLPIYEYLRSDKLNFLVNVAKYSDQLSVENSFIKPTI